MEMGKCYISGLRGCFSFLEGWLLDILQHTPVIWTQVIWLQSYPSCLHATSKCLNNSPMHFWYKKIPSATPLSPNFLSQGLLSSGFCPSLHSFITIVYPGSLPRQKVSPGQREDLSYAPCVPSPCTPPPAAPLSASLLLQLTFTYLHISVANEGKVASLKWYKRWRPVQLNLFPPILRSRILLVERQTLLESVFQPHNDL